MLIAQPSCAKHLFFIAYIFHKRISGSFRQIEFVSLSFKKDEFLFSFMEKVEISQELEDTIKQLFNTDVELGGYFLAEKENGVLRIINGKLSEHKDLSASVNYLPREYVDLVRAEPDRYEILSAHFHSRSYGKMIEEYDPYWTITQDDGNFRPGQKVDGKFYVSRQDYRWKGKSIGDSDVVEFLAQQLKQNNGLDVRKALFIHPKHFTEGTQMNPDKVAITCYEHDPNARFRVNEVPVMNSVGSY